MIHSIKTHLPFFLLLLIISCSSSNTETQKASIDMPPKLKALIIDGENNHGVWPMTTMMMSDYLKQTGLFEVDYARTSNTWQGPHFDSSIGLEDITELLTKYPLPNSPQTTIVKEPVPDTNFSPNFGDYDLVVSNLGWKASNWPAKTKANFEAYMKNGGGLVVIHAANNSWGDWEAYNKMIGLGGWGGRNTDSGPYAYYTDSNELIIDPTNGQCGSHGPQMEFVLTTRAADHPIMKGLPNKWLHTKDELYDRLRGPAENMTILATAYSDVEGNGPPWDKKVQGSGRHEPMLMAMEYEKGKIFHSALGHMDYSMECVGFITTFQRGAEWAATGKVTQKIPKDFPSEGSTSSRSWKWGE